LRLYNTKIIVVCVLSLLPLLVHSKPGKVYGRVTDDKGNPIEQCLVRAINSDRTTYSSKLGDFSLEYDIDSSKSLIVSCAGYEIQEVSIDDEPLWIVLSHKTNVLQDVVVTDMHGGGKIKQGSIGKRNLKPYGKCAGHMGSETAIFLNADLGKHGLLKEIFLYITKDGNPGAAFKVHVYDMDKNKLPGYDFIGRNEILRAHKGDEWVRLDVSSMHIPVGGGLFISMEWISGMGNHPDIIDSKKDEEGDLKKYDGPVLAFTRGYYKQGAISCDRAGGAWHNFDNAPDRRKNYINPMIYATYTYVEK